MKNSIFAVLGLTLCCLFIFSDEVKAQGSEGYLNRERSFNNGGNPSPVLVSENFQINLGSLGENLTMSSCESNDYTLVGGFSFSYPPPGEVMNLRFVDSSILEWDADLSAGTYNVYRGLVSELATTYGSCHIVDIGQVQASDPEIPVQGECYFYIVTACNRVGEEGTMGRDSSDTERPNVSPCQ